MNPDRRASLAVIGIGVVVGAACLFAAHLLPDGGPLGFISTVLKFVGTLVVFSLPLRIWKTFWPDSAARWERSGGRPIPLLAPLLFWVATTVVAWILLTGVEPPATRLDHVALVFMWSVVAGSAAFSIAFTRMYLKDRRGRAE